MKLEKCERVHGISNYIENKLNILKDLLPYKIPSLDRQLMIEAAGEEPKGFLSWWVSLGAGNHCPSQVPTWRKALEQQLHSAGVTVRRYPMSKSQQDSRRGKITFRTKPHICQRSSEGSNKPWVHQDTENQQKLRQNCVWVSPVEVKGQWTSAESGLWVLWVSLGAADLGIA